MIENNNEKNMPIGFAFSLALNQNAMKNFSNLDHLTQEKIKNYIQASQTGEEAKSRINTVIEDLNNNSTQFLSN